jgi:N-acetylmuramoyl-L-alanine amidase
VHRTTLGVAPDLPWRRTARHRETAITLASLPLRPGSHGPDVADLQRRLRAAGFAAEDAPGEFGPSTRGALIAFQSAHGLDPDGECDAATWGALIETEYRLGDRLLCLRSPMMRGDDVSELQLRLGALGFDAGRVDGILGHVTQQAVADFQRNAGLVSDKVCGPETVDALVRLEGRGGTATVTGVRERDRLRRRRSNPSELRVAVGAAGTMHPVLSGFAAELQVSGTSTLLLDDRDWSAQASATNEFAADLFIGLVVADEPTVEACYFSVPGYESDGGRRLAELVVKELPAAPGWGVGTVRGMRLPILRETRPPAVLVRLGDAELLETSAALVIASLQRALHAWVTDPC